MLQSYSFLGTFTFIILVLILKLIENLVYIICSIVNYVVFTSVYNLYHFNLHQHLYFKRNEHCKWFFTTFQTLTKHFECCHFDLIINGVNFCLPKVLFCNYNGRLHAKTCFLYIVSQIICAFLFYQTLMLCIKAIKMQFLVLQVL